MPRKKTEEALKPPPPPVTELPEFLYIEEVHKIISSAESSTIVDAEDYFYFCIAPSYEKVQFLKLYSDRYIQVFKVLNFKDNTIGYLIYFESFPQHRRPSDFGAAFFFSKIRDRFKSYKGLETAFADEKFRILCFDGKDYFASVKWKSTNPLGGEPVE